MNNLWFELELTFYSVHSQQHDEDDTMTKTVLMAMLGHRTHPAFKKMNYYYYYYYYY